MEEQKLEIKENGQYNNITMKTRYQWDGANKQFKFDNDGNKIVKEQGLKPDHYTIVEKTFAEGRPIETKYGTSYSVMVKYDDKDVGFFLKPYEHEAYAETGGEGDKVKISCVIEQRLNKKVGAKLPVEVLKFEKVE